VGFAAGGFRHDAVRPLPRRLRDRDSAKTGGEKAVGEAFDQILPIGLAGQIAQQYDAYNNVR